MPYTVAFRRGIVAIVVATTIGAGTALATVKVIGDFEGSLDSAYPGISWFADTGITVPVEFISVNDPDYRGGVTRGEQALLLTTPSAWDGPDFFSLSGGEGMLTDMATFPYLLFDVTTYGDSTTPDEGPIWRQVFNIFNNPVTGWYDSNNDNDIQLDFQPAGFAEDSFTATVIVDMTGPDPAVNDDDTNFFHLRAQEALADHTDGTPIDDLYWQILWAFQGGNQPESTEIQMVIDNVRFCDTLDCTETTLDGDFNMDGSVDAADYVVWRDGTGAQEQYDLWRANFGRTGGGAALVSGQTSSAAVPEPDAIGLLVIAAACLATRSRRIRVAAQ